MYYTSTWGMCSRTVDEKHVRHICTKLRKSADILSVFVFDEFVEVLDIFLQINFN